MGEEEEEEEIISPKEESVSRKVFIGKGNKYNLTEKQSEMLHWIVQNVRDGKLDEEFTFVYLNNGRIRFMGGTSKVIPNPPFLSEGTLNALMASSLILVNKNENGWVNCTLLGKAYEAVDSDFNVLEDTIDIPLSNSILGIPNKKYTYDLFMLMPFTSELNPIYENHIKKVAGKLKLSIARADDFFSQNLIMHEIWSAIARASILVADCTNKNPNVFYEIGLAHAINKPVILITQNQNDVPFDLRHRRYILYTDAPASMEKFETDLYLTILETKKDLSASKS